MWQGRDRDQYVYSDRWGGSNGSACYPRSLIAAFNAQARDGRPEFVPWAGMSGSQDADMMALGWIARGILSECIPASPFFCRQVWLWRV